MRFFYIRTFSQNIRELSYPIFILALLAVLLQTLPAIADGAYFPEKAYKKLPAIPTQRALLVYKDKTEQLVIESALDAEGQRFGWIVPVPAQPTKIEKSSSGLLCTLSLNMEPHIVHDHGEILYPLYGIPVVIIIWLLFAVFEPSRNRFLLTFRLFSLLLLYSAFGVLFLPALGRSRGVFLGKSMLAGEEYVAGVQVIESSVIGNYDVTVLTAQNADALNAWLTNNDLTPLPDRGQKIANDYIRDKWVFVTAKLQRNGSGLSTPHPLAMTFPTASPVYPMKLTSLVEEPVYLELFVVADKRAETRKLDLEMTDRFWFQPNWGGRGKCFLGETFYTTIGLPNASDFLWDCCTISKLTGTLKPRHMKKDFYITFSESVAYQRTLYSSRGARETGLIWAICLWSLLLPLGFIIAYNPEADFCNLKRVFIPLTLSALILGALIFFTLPKTEITSGYTGKGFHALNSYGIAFDKLENKPGSKIAPNDQQAIEAFFHQYLTENTVANPYTGKRVRREISPGDYTIENIDDKLFFTTYDRHGFVIKYGLNNSLK